VTPPGLTVKPRSVYAWQVLVWENQDQAIARIVPGAKSVAGINSEWLRV
jgi:hypothetical protein